MNNRLLEFFDAIYWVATPECPNTVEIAVNGGTRFLLTRNPEHIKTILTTKFAEFGKGPRFHKIWSPFLGDSIFTTDGRIWSDCRSLIRPMFVKDRVRDLDIFQKWTDKLISKMPGSGETVEMMDLFYRMTLDVTTDFLLGDSIHSLEKRVSSPAFIICEVSQELANPSPVPITSSSKRSRKCSGFKCFRPSWCKCSESWGMATVPSAVDISQSSRANLPSVPVQTRHPDSREVHGAVHP